MSSPDLPYLIQADSLARIITSLTNRVNLRIICSGNQEQFIKGHVPGAVWLNSAYLNRGIPPAPGLLPDPEVLEKVFSYIGVSASNHVVCYDDNGGTHGARLMWVLEAMGHRQISMLDGGLEAWMASNLPLDTGNAAVSPARIPWRALPNPNVVVDKNYVLSKLGDSSVRILDVRSNDEYMGRATRSARKGHIPGATHLHWLDTVDENNHHRIKAKEILEAMLTKRDIHRHHEIIVHCQTHQRSSHSFVVLRSLGFQHVKAYAGSWMEWAADKAMPIICEDTANR